MSEPEIATLARRLAEQNNVDWRILSGTGPDGKILERDVLDYLARVMAGEEAVNPTPEPLPEGMEAWPDQDAPTYHRPNGASSAARSELGPIESSEVHEGVEALDDLLADVPEVDDRADANAATEPEPFAAPTFENDPVSAEEELPDDIFLFDDTEPEAPAAADEPSADLYVADGEPEAPAAPYEPSADLYSAGTDTGFGTTTDAGEADPYGGTEFGSVEDDLDDDDALLVADDEAPQRGDVEDVEGFEPFERVADAGAVESDDPFAGSAREVEELSANESPAGSVFDAPIGGYDQEFTTPSEQFESESAEDTWPGQHTSDLVSDTVSFERTDEVDEGDLPDLWAGDEGEAADAGEYDAGPSLEAAFTDGAPAEPFQPFGAVGAEHESEEPLGTIADELSLSMEDDVAEADVADAPVAATSGEHQHGHAQDDVQDLDLAESLDELESVNDLHDLDGEHGALPGVSFGELPLVRTGNVLRRHVDLSSLAGAQLAAGLELGHDEPLSPAPFLLRAVARAARSVGGVNGQVALAELDGDLHLRRVDDAGNLAFAALVEELAKPGPEEDELGLVAVDLSAFDVDEVLLDLDVPAITLGRILYDTQGGSHRSTLTLSGDLGMAEGAKLLARVAELLEAPVRLLL